MIFPRTVQLVFFHLRLVLYTCVQTFDVVGGDKKKFNNEVLEGLSIRDPQGIPQGRKKI
jgi:hypothetical protein